MRSTFLTTITTALLLVGCKSTDEGQDGGLGGVTGSGGSGINAGLDAKAGGGGTASAGGVVGTGGGGTIGTVGSGGTGPGGTGGMVGLDAGALDTGRDDSAFEAGIADAGLDGTAADAGAADANLHGGATRWTSFDRPGFTSTYYFDRCSWFSDTEGYCVLLKNGTSTAGSKTSDLFKTTDGGKTFALIATIDGGNTAFDGDMDVYVLSPTEIWYTTAFVGAGYAGTIGRSTNSGQTFESLTAKVHTALADPGVTTVPSFPLWKLVKAGGTIWVGSWSKYLARSSDGGATWERVAGPYDLTVAEAPDLIATKTDLLLRYTRSFMIELYRLAGTSFVKVEAAFPAPSDTDHGDTWWRASPFGAGVVFVDQRPWSWWGWPFAVNATVDGGKSFQKLLSGQSASTSDVAGLRDALVVSGSLAYVCGVFTGTDGNKYSEIRKSTDGGLTWAVVHSEPLGTSYATVVLDPTGRAHAMRHVTDAYANLYSYTGHYVLP